ncbi:MAG: Dna2/Cas4 domain-containing protein [Bdellovibrionota bacterium]
MTENSAVRIITAPEVANYVVCPEAWRLKFLGIGARQENSRTVESQEIRAEFARKQDLSSKLASYSKVAYILLVLLVALVFILEQQRTKYFENILNRLRSAHGQGGISDLGSGVPAEILSLLLVLGLIIFMWDFFERRSRTVRKSSGLGETAQAIAVKGSAELPPKQFISKELGLKSKPDALAKEGQMLIPIDIHPLTNKIRDRHIVQLLVHLRLIEEAEGRRPEHGILLMGKEQRKVHIKNTYEKQRWLDTLIDEMRSIMDGIPAVPSPAPYKCRTCDVRSVCEFSVAKPRGLRFEPDRAESKGDVDDHEDND